MGKERETKSVIKILGTSALVLMRALPAMGADIPSEVTLIKKTKEGASMRKIFH